GRAVAQETKLPNRARARAWTWPAGAARPLWGAAWPRGDFAFVVRLREWIAQEVAAGRLPPWLAVAYGFGIVIYFTADREPVWPIAAGAAGVCALVTVALRRHLAAFVAGLFVTAIAAGFAGATIKTASIAHPVLRFNASGATVAGFVE